MQNTPLWTLLPTVVALALGLALLVLARRHGWKEAAISTDTPDLEDNNKAKKPNVMRDIRSTARDILSIYRWEILLAGVIFGLLTCIFFAAPVQLTGKISTYPSEAGRPFFFLHWIRNHLQLFYHETASVSNFLTGLASLILITIAAFQRSITKARSGILWGLMSLAGCAQWMISDGNLSTGIWFYLIAGLGFFLWSKLAKDNISHALLKSKPIPTYWEVILVTLILGFATFARMYALDIIPYGIEGDEAKWTAEVVALGILGEPDASGMYHRDALPGSFFMQTPFHKVMGPSLYTARFEVAFFSILGTFVFYLLLRHLTSISIALLASWFLSASIFDISASRLANVESHVKLWPILTLALLLWALHTKRWQAYAITGIALAIGILTYDTVWPIGLVVLILVFSETYHQKEDPQKIIRHLTTLLIPTILTIPILIPYVTSRLYYYEVGNKGWEHGYVTFWLHLSDVVFSWYRFTFQDFLYNREGPLLNAFLLPWMTFGLVSMLANPRLRLATWTLVWALLFIFPVPILTNAPFGRVYYPALPAVYILVAIGIYIFWRESLRAMGNGLQPFMASVFLIVLMWIPLFNLYIYFNEVIDHDDRRMRREVAELAADAASLETLLILATVPNYNEPLNNEYQMIELFMLEKLPKHQVKESYKKISLNEIIPSLRNLSVRPNRSIILDKVSNNNRQERDDLAKALAMCYPQAKWIKGDYFDRVDIDANALADTKCVSTELALEFTPEGRFSWRLSNGATNKILLLCEIQQISHVWVEAETLPITSGWQPETTYVTDWTGNGFILDSFGSEPIYYNFDVAENGPLYIWIKYYKRTVDNSPPRIAINNNIQIFASIGEDKINQWNWERIGPFDLSTGIHTIELDRPYLDNPSQFMAIFIDTLVFTSKSDFMPLEIHYQTISPLHYSLRQEQSQGSLEQNLEPGTYRCSIETSNKYLVDAFGRSPIKSNTVDFTITP